MKKFFLVGFICFIISCKAQNKDFNAYLSNYNYVELPLKVDRKTYNNLFYSHGNYNEISESWLKEFVCKDSLKYKIDPTEFRYDFGVRFNTNNGYIAVLIHKQKYEGESVYDFDLSETILTIYSNSGEILSQKVIGKDNDGWISNIDISNNEINVQQLKVLEFNKPELTCEIEEKKYSVNKNGVIVLDDTNFIKKGIVYWDKQLENFVLK